MFHPVHEVVQVTWNSGESGFQEQISYLRFLERHIMLFVDDQVLSENATTVYSSSQLIIFVNEEWKVSLKVFKRVKHLWVLKFHKNNAIREISTNQCLTITQISAHLQCTDQTYTAAKFDAEASIKRRLLHLLVYS